MINAAQKRAQLNREAILSASPARLLTMLYDRLLLDLGRAEIAQQAGQWSVASENLIHAQTIVTELSTTLNRDVWDGADDLMALYNYATTAMVKANTSRDPAKTREAIDLLEPLRQSWQEAANLQVAAPEPAASAPMPRGTLGVG